MTIEQIAELSAEIVEAKRRVSSIENNILGIKDANSSVGVLEIKFPNQKEHYEYFLGKEELLIVLEKRLTQAKDYLTRSIEKYEGSFDPTPIINVSENVQQTTNVITTQNIVNDGL